MLKLICYLSISLLLSSSLYSDTYSLTAKIPNGKSFTLLNEGSATGLQAGKFVNIDASGTEPLPGFPPSSPYAKLKEEQVLSSGKTLSQLVVGALTPSGWYPLLYIPDEPVVIQLLEEFRKSDIGTKEMRSALPHFTHLQLNDTPLVIGVMELRGGPKIPFQYDPSFGMEELLINPTSVPLALNNKGDILLFDALNTQFDLLVDGSLIPLNDLGLKEPLMMLDEDVNLTEDNLDIMLLDDGSLVGRVGIDDKDMLFLRSSDGSMYLSGITDKASESSPLWHVKRYAAIANEGKGADILFSTSEGLYRLKNGTKIPEKVSLPTELSPLAFANIEGKIWVVAKPKAAEATLAQIVLWKEGEKPLKLIDMMEDKSLATYQVDDADEAVSFASINNQGDLKLNLSLEDEQMSILLKREVSNEKTKE